MKGEEKHMKINLDGNINSVNTKITDVNEDGEEIVIAEETTDLTKLKETQQQLNDLARNVCNTYSEAAKKGLANEAFMDQLIIDCFTQPIVHDNARYFIDRITINRFKSRILTLAKQGLEDRKAEAAEKQEEVTEESPVEEEICETTPIEEPAKPEDTEETILVAKPLEFKEVDYKVKAGEYFMEHEEEFENLFKVPELKIRYHRETYPDLPEVVQHGNFIDLYVAKGCRLKEGEFKLIDLGVSVECPDGYWMQLVPRSSTFKKYGIIQTNSFGVIDTSYCGDNDIVMLPVYATRNTVIPKGERICQFRLVRDIPFSIKSVNKLEGPDRGGFGSTGRK